MLLNMKYCDLLSFQSPSPLSPGMLNASATQHSTGCGVMARAVAKCRVADDVDTVSRKLFEHEHSCHTNRYRELYMGTMDLLFYVPTLAV